MWRSDVNVCSLPQSVLYSLIQGHSWNLELTDLLVGLSCEPRGLLVTLSPALGLQARGSLAWHFFFSTGTEDPIWAEVSPQPFSALGFLLFSGSYW